MTEPDDKAPAKKKAPPKVTAFELDGSVVGDVDAHPFAFGGFPGLWQVGRPTLASALGLTNDGLRELIAKFNLPLVEVKVNEKDAHASFPADPNRILTGPQSIEPAQAQPELLNVNGSLVPGPTPAGTHPDLQPFAAAHIAENMKRLYPDAPAEEIVDALPLAEGGEAEQAAIEAAGAVEEVAS